MPDWIYSNRVGAIIDLLCRELLMFVFPGIVVINVSLFRKVSEGIAAVEKPERNCKEVVVDDPTVGSEKSHEQEDIS